MATSKSRRIAGMTAAAIIAASAVATVHLRAEQTNATETAASARTDTSFSDIIAELERTGRTNGPAYRGLLEMERAAKRDLDPVELERDQERMRAFQAAVSGYNEQARSLATTMDLGKMRKLESELAERHERNTAIREIEAYLANATTEQLTNLAAKLKQGGETQAKPAK